MVVKWAGCVSLGPDAEEARVAPAGGLLGATTMERYGGAFEEAVDGARQQERHYQLLSALQSLVKELPSSFQQRLSYTTLSDLALALLDGTVFEIVQGLLEIQHLTEKSLYNQRLRLQNEHRGSVPLPAAQSPTPPLPPHPHYALSPFGTKNLFTRATPSALGSSQTYPLRGLRSPFLQGGGDWLPLLSLVTAKARQWPQLSSHPVEAGCCPEICSNV
ncbi:protein DGCR6L isoform X3 [Leopardus geoffroyi]|uniref:protein DGCR6L isoform X3 n=1 Tax=Leopardus geoffroyi TaxID=46844 RepID=UPI001E2651A3|nr:protein DGCR6L isoform X3 [Leopardus geoffroyi]